MRKLIRKELDVDSPVNLRRLPPMMKVYAGLMVKIHDSRWYQVNKHKKEEQEYARQIQQDEKLKDALLAVLYRELVSNKTLVEKDDVCSEIIIGIDAKFKKSLDRILIQKDFIIYDISEVQEQPDIRKAFPNMYILLRASKRVV